MLIRQRVLVSMLQQAGGTANKLQFMKWAFLLSQETASGGGDNFYQFVPYRYGPYSFSLQQEVESLIRDGLMQGSGDVAWRLTEAGHKTPTAISSEVDRDVSSILDKYGRLTVNELVDTVYANYSWFTINSANARRRCREKPHADLATYTMGYEGLLIDGFLNRLLTQGLFAIIDVRNNPISRRYGYHKNTLARLCRDVGLDYDHFPELGIPTGGRQGLHSSQDYNTLFTSYERDTLAREKASVQAVSTLVATKPSALVCMEANPNSCHRSRLATAVSAISNLAIVHLGWPR